MNNANIQNVLKDISKNQFCEGKYVKNAGVPPMKFCLNWFAPESNKKDWYRKVMMLCSFVIRNPCWRRSKDLWASAENLAGLGCGSSCRLEKTWKPQELPSRMQTQTAFKNLIVLWPTMIQSLDQQFNRWVLEWPWEQDFGFLSILWLSFSPYYIQPPVNMWTMWQNSNEWNSIAKLSHCLKIAQNVSFELSNFGIIHQFLTCLVTYFDRKLQVLKSRQNWLFLTFLLNFCPLARNVEWDFFYDFQTPWLKV